jgi:hypothetical protein
MKKRQGERLSYSAIGMVKPRGQRVKGKEKEVEEWGTVRVGEGEEKEKIRKMGEGGGGTEEGKSWRRGGEGEDGEGREGGVTMGRGERGGGGEFQEK